MNLLFISIVAVAIVAVLGFKALARKSFGKEREPLSLVEIYALVNNRVSAEVFNEVWSKVGDAFSIDPRLVRPDDTLKSLNAIDSWDLGKGGDTLSQWLENKQLGKPPALETVLDLALWIEASKGTRKDV
ncbi:hypothetical protein ACN9M1_05885 [Ralstonia sp. R-29]|uniref:hypothetical protein n=1 Tax=Ralstonia sp. R-29 TaxID=3404059 RepID=UPI003CF0594F